MKYVVRGIIILVVGTTLWVVRMRGVGNPIMANEAAAVEMCKKYCTAQDIYRRTVHNKVGILEYAQRLKGKDSLLESTPGAKDINLIDQAFADAEGNPGKATPKSGYCFKVLTKQGDKAPGGVKNYIKDGHMIYGYALFAYPAKYGVTGKNCFAVNNAGTIISNDLGPKTLTIVETLDEFNFDVSWPHEG